MRKPMYLRLLSCLLLAAVLCSGIPLPAAASTTSEIKDEINDLKVENAIIQSQIDAIKAQYDENASEIQQLVSKKDAADRQISLLHEQILNTNEQLRVYGQLIADTQEELEAAQKRLDDLNEKHKARIRAMEEQGTISYWQVLFESKSFLELLDRMNMVDEIAAADRRRLEEMRIAAEEVEKTRNRLSVERDDLEETRTMLTASEAELTAKRTESDDLLRQLVSKKEEYQYMLDESEALQEELMQEMAKKQRELQAAQYKEELVKMALKGQNPPSNASWKVPVSDYVITSPFGMRVHPVYKTSRMHNGVDLACAQGTPIYATRSGTVTTAAYQAGGAGYYVSISHGDGFASIYMHMTRYVVSKGQSVSQGQLIGYVGSTGVSTGPHLHFGISYGGTYVNPMAYI